MNKPLLTELKNVEPKLKPLQAMNVVFCLYVCYLLILPKSASGSQSNSWPLKKNDFVLRIHFLDLGDFSSVSSFPSYSDMSLPLPQFLSSQWSSNISLLQILWDLKY